MLFAVTADRLAKLFFIACNVKNIVLYLKRNTEILSKFINSFYSCGVYILLQLFKYLAIGTIYEGGITYGKFEGTDSGIAKDH